MDRERQFASTTEFFRRRGVKNPEDWARSLLDGNPEYARLQFLQQVGTQALGDNVADWIKGELLYADHQPDGDFAGTGRALRALLERGVTSEEIGSLVREVQKQMLFYTCRLLSDSAGRSDWEQDFYCFGVYDLDEQGQPGRRLRELHRGLLEVTPPKA